MSARKKMQRKWNMAGTSEKINSMMDLIGRCSKFSKGFYCVILALTIPFYLVLYGASGHRFDPPTEDIVWMIVIALALVTMILYLTLEKADGVGAKTIKFILGITMVATGYGAIRIFVSMIQFEFDESVRFIVQGLSYLVPIIFLFSIVVIFRGLFIRESK